MATFYNPYEDQSVHLAVGREWLEQKLNTTLYSLNTLGNNAVLTSVSREEPNEQEMFSMFSTSFTQAEIKHNKKVFGYAGPSLTICLLTKALETGDRIFFKMNNREYVKLLWVVDHSFSLEAIGRDVTWEKKLSRQGIPRDMWTAYAPYIGYGSEKGIEEFKQLNARLKENFISILGAGYGDRTRVSSLGRTH